MHSQTCVAAADSILTLKFKRDLNTHTHILKCVYAHIYVCMHIYMYVWEKQHPIFESPLAGHTHPGRHRAQGKNSLQFENSQVAIDTPIETGSEVFMFSRGMGTSLGSCLMRLILRQNGEIGTPHADLQQVLQRTNSEPVYFCSENCSFLLFFFVARLYLKVWVLGIIKIRDIM